PVVPQATQEALAQQDIAQPPGVAAPLSSPEDFGTHEAIIQGALAHLLKRFTQEALAIQKDAGSAMDDMYGYIKRHMEIDQEKLRHAETVIDQLVTKVAQEGLQLRHDPYQVTVQAVSPEGYPVSITVA